MPSVSNIAVGAAMAGAAGRGVAPKHGAAVVPGIAGADGGKITAEQVDDLKVKLKKLKEKYGKGRNIGEALAVKAEKHKSGGGKKKKKRS